MWNIPLQAEEEYFYGCWKVSLNPPVNGAPFDALQDGASKAAATSLPNAS